MKTATIRTNRPAVAFPNAATPRQVFHRVLDIVLTAACGMGLAAMFLLALVLV